MKKSLIWKIVILLGVGLIFIIPLTIRSAVTMSSTPVAAESVQSSTPISMAPASTAESAFMHYKFINDDGSTVYVEDISDFAYLDITAMSHPPYCMGEHVGYDPLQWIIDGVQHNKPLPLFYKPTMWGECYYSTDGWTP